MSAKTNYFKIGLFVLIGGVVFVLALIAFGLRGYFEENTLYETYIDTDVEGLSIGSPVNFRGVNVGKVTWIGFPWARYPKADLATNRFQGQEGARVHSSALHG